MFIKVESDWTLPEKEQIVITLDGHEFMLYQHPSMLDRYMYGIVDAGSFALSPSEAREFAKELLKEAERMEETERDMQAYFQQEKEKQDVDE